MQKPNFKINRVSDEMTIGATIPFPAAPKHEVEVTQECRKKLK